MSDNIIQSSFAAGELSPSLFARVDFAKYRSGAATMRNFFVDYRSGASTRPGTEFIRPAKYIGRKVRLVRFQQSVSVTYALEFGDQYIRFATQASSVVETGFSVTAVTNGTPATITAPSHNFAVGDMIFISGVGGIPQINNRYFDVGSVTGSNVTLLDSLTKTTINSSPWGTFTSAGTVQRVFTVPTPYTQSELAMLKFSQRAAQMNITHPNHPPYTLTLIAATSWTLVPTVIGSSIGAPPAFTPTGPAAGPASYKYVVTAVDANGQESVPSPAGIINATQDLRLITGTNHVPFTGVTGAQFYNVYAASPSYIGQNADASQVGFIASTINGNFVDSNISPDFSQVPPVGQNPFASVNPQVSTYFQQRLLFANGGGNLVQTFWAGRVGSAPNFNISFPSQADDAITGALVSLEVNEIKSMVPMPSGLIVLTTKGAWQISGGAGGVATQGGPITPSTLTATPQAYVGANDVPPILINYDILFVQQKGSIVRDLTYNIYSNIYTGNDISILANHLFYGHQILEWAYSEEPFKIVWTIREDGTMLSLTVLKEQDMYGWARHDTRGNFKSVCTITEGAVDATYVAVDRPNPLGTGMVTQIERIADRTFTFGAEDAWSVDAGVKTTSTFPAATLTITPPDTSNNVTMVSGAALFSSGNVGSIVRVNGGIIKITGFTNTTTVNGLVLQAMTSLIPDDPLNRPQIAQSGNWTMDAPFTKVFGLDHLEGQTVSVLADGGVVNGLVVSGGSITLPNPVTKVVAGYGYQAQLQTMYLDLGNETNSVQGKRKKVGALTVRVKDSRGLKAGRTFNLVTPMKELNRVTTMGFPISLITSDERIIMDPLWDVPGQICLQVDDPVPVTVLGVIPEVVIGDTPK